MKLQDTDEYKAVKFLTSEENVKAMKQAIIDGVLFMTVGFASMYVFLFLFLWIWGI